MTLNLRDEDSHFKMRVDVVAGNICQALNAGEDCSRLWCPGQCSGHGMCISGTCACDAMWGGPDCTADKVEAMMPTIAPLVELNLSWAGGSGGRAWQILLATS